MKRILALIFLISAILTGVNAQLASFSDSTKLSLLTCSPGPVAYEKFGHTAIRILDENQGVDIIANWGIFDFDEPGFYFKFIKGYTYYNLGITETYYFLEGYRRRNSSVTEQVLNLSNEEKKRLLDAILVNYQPENRRYLYNFVFDNCATRPMVMIDEIIRPKVIKSTNAIEDRTFRDWVGEYTGKKSWLQFGIDLVFGKDADQIATPVEALFLPEVLNRYYDKAVIADENGTKVLLVSEEKILVERVDVPEKSNFLTLPVFATSLLLVLGILITFFENKNKKHYKIFDALLLTVTGIAGLIIFYLMFFSIHPLVKSNFNILWANPLNLLAVALLFNKKAGSFLKRYFDAYFILLAFCFVVAVLRLQVFNIAFLPIMALLLVRVMYWFQVQKRMKVSL